MAGIAAKLLDKEESKDFAALLGETLSENETFIGSVVTGTIVGFTPDSVIVDVGLKSEGRIPFKEFGIAGSKPDLNMGDSVEVFVERLEDKNGEAVLSRDKARREEAWADLEKLHAKEEHVTGVMFGKVKGGFTVDLNGAVAFLPGSQVDIRPIRDVSALMGTPQPFQILKMDRVVQFWKNHAKNYVPILWTQSKKVKSLLVLLKTSQITVRLLILAVLMDCCTLRIFRINVLTTHPKPYPLVNQLT
jgi:ribosomal protein S1